MIIAIGYWMILFTLCQSKYIEVNSEGNSSTDCCMKGTCPCGSLYKAFQYVDNGTVIIITSSIISLHNVSFMQNLNNIIIIGNNVTVICNDSGVLEFYSCSKIVFKGITWDQCGDPSTSPYQALGFLYAINISVMECTFQYSKVCTVVGVTGFPSGFVQVHDSKLLFNQLTYPLLCEHALNGLRANLIIFDVHNSYDIIQNHYVSIKRTLFYHNGPYHYNVSTGSNVPVSTGSAALVCYFGSPQSVQVYMDNLTVSTSFALWVHYCGSKITSGCWCACVTEYGTLFWFSCIIELPTAVFAYRKRKYQYYICSSHSYNYSMI